MIRSVCVLGLGYVGLPTAGMLASRGLSVLGVDIDEALVRRLTKGELRLQEPDLDTLVRAGLDSGHLRCATRAEHAEVFIVAVPTPVRPDRTADLDAVMAAADSIAGVLRKGDLVILESTVPPGTTVGPLRRALEQSGLRAGSDFLLAHCPERVLPGNLLLELVTNDRVVGGIDEASSAAAADLYRLFVTGQLFQTDATTAELVKLMENTYRDVNIALANEFALVAQDVGVDIWRAIELANRHPRVRFLRPGPGVGGHCIAVDPWFVVEAAPDAARLIRTARQVNDAMPGQVAEFVAHAVGGLEGKVVVALGLTYKADVADTRESPSADVIVALHRAGATVREHDAVVASAQAVDDLAAGSDAIVLLVDHSAYRALDPARVGARMRSRVIVDTRGTVDEGRWRSAGFRVARLGTRLD